MEELLKNDLVVALVRNVAFPAIAIATALLFQRGILFLFRRQRIIHTDLTQLLVEHTRRSLLWLLILIAIAAVLPLTQLPGEAITRIQTLLKPITVGCLGWMIAASIRASGRWLEVYYPKTHARDTKGIQRFNTQINTLMRVVIIVIAILTVIGMALVIPSLREFGMSLFTSAGVAGIVIGVAAKEALSNIIAGVQLAMSQQILLGDEVVVEEELGTVEEITSSYVVIKLWDLRRRIVPLRYFMENSFENWTYRAPDLVGTVYLQADYTVDVEAVRASALDIVKQSKYWDQKRCELLVTDSREKTLELRVTISARNSGDLWSLRCELREKLVAQLQATQPQALPRERVIYYSDPEQPTAA